MSTTNNIFDKASILLVTREWPGLTKSLSKEFINVENADKRRFHGQKDLYKSYVIKKLFSNEVKLDATLDLLCLPFPLKNGFRILPIDMVNEVEETLKNHVAARTEIISEFSQKEEGSVLTVYDQIIVDSQQFLGNAFNPADYAPVEVFISQFGFEWEYLDMNPSKLLMKVKKEYYERESKKLAKKWEEAGEAAQQLLRASMADMVSHLVDRLSSKEDGKKKIFRDTVMDPINEFIRTFPARNLTDDAELQELVNQTKQLVGGVNPENLRNNEGLRDTVQTGFTEIKSKLDTMIVKMPKRAIRFED
jgi:hypothetical protein